MSDVICPMVEAPDVQYVFRVPGEDGFTPVQGEGLCSSALSIEAVVNNLYSWNRRSVAARVDSVDVAVKPEYF